MTLGARGWRTGAAALFVVAAAAVCLGCGQPGDVAVFTTAHRTAGDAVRDFLGVRPAVQQPIPFPHNVHIAKGLTCTAYCHESATKGPIAGLPGVKTCMICHGAIATDRPVIQQVAAYETQHLDIPWQRVYGYSSQAHVRFNHAPHLRARVECSTCHGNVAQQTVAARAVNLNMGFCVNCHKAKSASNDCLTCHF